LLAGLVLGVPTVRDAMGYALSGDLQAFRHALGGWEGVLVLEALALAHAVIWYPAEILNAVAGLLYGFWLGLAIIHVGWIASGFVAYAIGRHLGRPGVRRIAGEERLERLEKLIERGGWPALLAARAIPIIPFSLFSFVAGAARVPVWRFAWTTAIGFLPLTAIVVLFGARARELSPTDPLLWLSCAGMLAMVAASVVVARRLRW
jgi:uncharacterized membrane protein YdjX (TVP38/TMEM64 family)